MLHGYESTSKVTPTTSLDDDLSMDELGEAFVELSHNYDFLKKKYLKMKKENESLNHQVFTLSKEKDELLSTLVSTEKDFDNYKISCKGKFPQVDKNEITMLKEKIDSLGVVLKKCEFDKKIDLRLCFLRNKPLRNNLMLILMFVLMFIPHNLYIMPNLLNMLTLHTHIMLSCTVKCFHVHIVAVKVT